MKISKGMAIYVERKRAGGLYYRQTAATLRSFARQTGEIELACITKSQICSFLDSGRKANQDTWVRKYRTVKAFLKYWKYRGQLKALRMPPPRRGWVSTFVPLVYSHADLRRMLRATEISQRGHRPTSVDPFTFRTLLQFLYGTGVLISEALDLRRNDVDLNGNTIILRRKHIGTSRMIPIGRDVQELLSRYLDSPIRKHSESTNLFLNRGGRAIGYRAIYKGFRRLCSHAGITRHDGGRHRARIRDLRFTFAVHRLTSWFRQGVNVEQMLPALAEYLGEVDLRSMEKYLGLTPERFRKQLRKLDLNAAYSPAR